MVEDDPERGYRGGWWEEDLTEDEARFFPQKYFDRLLGASLPAGIVIEENFSVETVLVYGLTTNVCVEGTPRGAFELGYNVVLVEGCCASYTEAQHEAAVHNVEHILGTTTPLDELTEEFLPAAAA